MKISIVIPSYNSVSLNNQILSDLNIHSEFDEIILIDDASPDPQVKIHLAEWTESMPELNVVSNPKNMHFLRSSNMGLKMACGDIKILLSTDVRIAADLGSLVKNILIDKPFALIGGRLLLSDTGWNTFDGVTYPYLEGWLLAATSDTWEDLGYFDERYAPFDFEDVDLSTKARSLGFSLIPLNHPKIWHAGGRSIGFSQEREMQTRINMEKFRKKWIDNDNDGT